MFNQQLLEVLNVLNGDTGDFQETSWRSIKADPQKLIKANFYYLTKYFRIFEEDFLIGFKNIFNAEENKWLDVELDHKESIFYFTKSLIKYHPENNLWHKGKAVSDVIKTELFLKTLEVWLGINNCGNGHLFKMRDFVFSHLESKPIFVLIMRELKNCTYTQKNKGNLLEIIVPCCFNKNRLKKLNNVLYNKLYNELHTEVKKEIKGNLTSYIELRKYIVSKVSEKIEQEKEEINGIIRDFVNNNARDSFYKYLKSFVEKMSKANLLKPNVKLDVKGLANFLLVLYFYPQRVKFIYYYPVSLLKRTSSTGYSCFYKRKISRERIVMWRTLFNLETAPVSVQMYESKVLKECFKSATAAIAVRNMSHNIGSHVLANISTADIVKRPADMAMLTSYLQQRMDFVASLTSLSWSEWTEPVFFYCDLLQGFMDQGLLLDYIVRDDGYKAEDRKIQFEIGWSGDNKYITWTYKGASKKQQEGEGDFSIFGYDETEINDFFVALPGGTVGKQAFYGFLENAIRNAAKHNPKPGEGILKVFIKVEESEIDKHFYTLKYYDNLSRNRFLADKRKDLVDYVQNEIAKDPVDDTGGFKPGNWGIQEMKIYAGFLTHTHGYVVHEKENGEKFKLWAEEHDVDSYKLLSYKFALQKATLILIIDNNKKSKEHDSLKEIGIYFETFEDSERIKETIHRLSPQLLLFVIRNGNLKEKNILEFIHAHHSRLPARIILGVLDKGSDCTIENNPGVRVCKIQMDEYPNASNIKEWYKFIINIYKKWVTSTYYRRDHKLKIMVYFDRSKESTAVKVWKKIEEDLKNKLNEYDLNSIVSISCYHQSDEPNTNNLDNTCKYLLFDNHRKLDRLSNKSTFYQIIGHGSSGSGINNHTIFNQLQNAPSGFTGLLFILQLIETSLMRILLIDDRIATHVAEVLKCGKIIFKSCKAQALTSANIFFNLSFVYNNNKKGRNFLIKTGDPQYVRAENEDAKEGVHIRDNKVVCFVVFKGFGGDGEPQYGTFNNEVSAVFDAIVVHWGWLETQRDDENICLEPTEFLGSLMRFSPRIIITSGRAKTGDIPKEYPFIEFSTIENYVMRELSKYHLSKVLQSVF